ncbi:MAG TPA: nickel-responsive transcriptional regulator NikR [Phycisphaerae bacterium]|nr:nickel-responsive transcriptional regulator NikR [Phycisphaerae bacterium]
MSDLRRTTLAIEGDLLEKFDGWMAAHGYTNRSEAVRDLMRTALTEQEWSDPNARVAAALTILYDHAAHALAQELTHLQHEDYHAILCSQHVHMDHDHCMESILMRGKAGPLRRLADAIIATRGVRAGKLTLMSTNV